MKRLLAFIPAVVLCATASAQFTAIGPFTGTDSEDFETKPFGANPCVPTRIFNNKADLCDPGGCLIITSSWGFMCSIPAKSGNHFAGACGSRSVYTFDTGVSRFGGYFGTNCGTPDATISFYDGSGNLLGTQVAVIPADCNWYWNGWQATAGPVIRKIEVVSNAFGGAFIDMDDMEADFPCSGNRTVYCTSKVNSAGCTPSIGSTGIPSASAGSGFNITTINELDNRNGLYFYSKTGSNNAPFQGGFLCALAPLIRTPVQNSGGTAPCGGMYSIDFNAYIASGVDPALVSGQQVWMQTWSRDPASPSTTNLSDALSFTICP